MSWQIRVKQLTGNFLNSILPPVCANCRKVGTLLCADCLAQMPLLHEPVCTHCGRITDRQNSMCNGCRCQQTPLQQIRAAVSFADPVPDLIHKLKYYGQFALAEPLAKLMVEAWHRWQVPVTLVLPIPLHPDRMKKRGFNQSELLAQYLCHGLKLPMDPTAIKRIRHTQQQVNLSPVDRASNVAGAFWSDNYKVEGEEILLIDDVCTTNSTLSEAANALLNAGAKSVSGYCLARAM